MIGEIGPNLPNVPQFPKYIKTGITWSADDLYTWVRHHLMWNVEFNTFDDIRCNAVHDLGYLDQI